MKLDNISSSKRVVDFVVIGLFIVIVSIVFYNSLKLEKSFAKFNRYISAIENLYITNNTLDRFLTKKIKFINYDKIVLLENRFERNLKFLEKNNFIHNLKIDKTLKRLKSKYFKKKAYIERYKSYNATMLGSLIYVLNTQSTLNDKEKNLTYQELIDLIELYGGIRLSQEQVRKDISTVDNNLKNNLSKRVKYTHIHIKALIKQIRYIATISDKIESIKISQELKKLHYFTDQFFFSYLNDIKQSIFMLFVVSILLLIFFIYRNFIFYQNAKKLSTFVYAVENSDNTVVITDANRHITYVNEAFTKNTGYTKDEAIGKNPRILKSGLLPQKVYDEMNALLDKGKKWSGEFINKTKNGDIFYEKASITPMFMNDKLTGYLAIKLNITDYIEQKNKIVYLAIHDQLTDLKNRYAFNEEIEELLQNNDSKVAILFLDIDDFKIVNDSLGHNIGDKLLKSFSDKLIHNLNKEDRVYRFGGDEFVIVITKNVTNENISNIAQRIILLAKKSFYIDGNELNISASIGISIYPDDSKEIKTLLRYADVAMYSAKSDGKNSYKFYKENFSKQLQERINIEHELKGALKRDEFYMVYQPKYSLHDKKIVSLETLIRWKNKKLGSIGPDIFIPIAEKLELINDITDFVFTQTCKDLKELKQSLRDLQDISVNVSVAQLNNIYLLNDFKNSMKKYGVNSNDIVIEITETALMRDIENSIKTLNRFREIGFKISLDDFGTGYSSLNYLIKLPIDDLKIDKSFVDVMLDGKQELGMIKAIVSISKNFGFKTIAEGIETLEQENILKEIGVDLGQGYYFSKPLKKEDLIAKFGLSSGLSS